MSRHHHHHHHGHGDGPYDDPFLRCCCCPCFLMSYLLSGFRRCVFFACYPIFRCLGLDDDWVHPHYHRHRHFD